MFGEILEEKCNDFFFFFIDVFYDVFCLECILSNYL